MAGTMDRASAQVFTQSQIQEQAVFSLYIRFGLLVRPYRGDNDWADVSPLKMLGYSVDAKEGLSDKDRMEFLVDFCEHMILPLGLPKDYVEPWGDPGTKKRIFKTAKHLAFVRRNFERQDLEKYARAIACWQRDFNFLQSNYKRMQFSPMDWATAAKG